jgi:hypothetical protein
MSAILRTCAVVASLGCLWIGPTAHAGDPCKGNLKGCGSTVVSETASDFRGAIIVPGSEAANRAVAVSHGCDGCVWTLVIDCDRNNVDSPSYLNCNASHCPDGTAYRIYLQRPTDANPAFLDTICLSPTRRIVTAADLAVDVEKYLTRLRPPPTSIRAEPAGHAVVRLASYFVAEGPGTDASTLDVVTAAGPAQLGIDIAAGTYEWSFGDGATCRTTSPGMPYDGGDPIERCDDHVAHVYTTATSDTVSLRATWRGTYTFDVGYGPVGPLPIPGVGVTGPAATTTIAVREARAELIGG